MKTVTPWRVLALGLFINLLWGGNFSAVKLGLQAVPPLWSAFFRFLLGST
jgi:drug/metabolite transporter (DMT)-like permease